MTPPFQFEAANTPADFADFQRSYCAPFGRRALWRVVPLVLMVVVVFVGLTYLADFISDNLRTAQGIDVPPLLETAAVLVLGVLIYLALSRRLVARLSPPDLSRFTIAQSIRVDEEGFHTTSRLARATYFWPIFSAVSVSDSTVFLGMGPGAAVVVPKRVLGGPDAVAAFVAFARERIAAAAHAAT